VSHKRRLDRAAVVEAAASIADQVGFERLTLASVAGQLGVRIPSLYNHVAGLEGLKRDLALLSVQELTVRLSRAAIGKAADDAVFAIADAYRAFAKARPGLYAAHLRAPAPDHRELLDASLQLVGMVQAAIAAYGLRDDDSLHAVRGLRSIVHGFVSLELAGGFGLPLDLDESYRRLVRAFAGGLGRRVVSRTGADSH
jgi:AcrR family transcriptional regulator